MSSIEYKNDILTVEGVPLTTIAKEIGTPSYVYSKAEFTGSLNAFQAAFTGTSHLVCYSVKVNANLALLRLAAERGVGADIVSGGELFKALRAGISPDKIVFSGVGKKAAEMREALEANILMFNVESAEEMRLLARVAGEMNRRTKISLRINPDVDPRTHPYISTGMKENKFGLSREEALPVFAEAAQSPHLEVVGVDCHIGSQLTETEPFIEAAERLKKLVLDLRAAGHDIRYLDLGGGLGIRYKDEAPPSPADYASGLKKVLGDVPGLTMVLEPGRYLVGNSGVLLTEVLYNKANGDKHFVITDVAMNDLIRPSLYGAYHGVLPVKKTGETPLTVDVVGPICESSDFMAKDHPLQPVAGGDLLAVMSAGAYGFTMSSNYNARPRAAEVLVDGGHFTVVKPRETYEDLVRGE
ncbi:diaminopimelate decarboxylase [Deltaproteobacteria bacterium Smac51]|nr:diaminopimelate decarboxylase [Deltaproteobacteria bacterium Smac51]